MRGLETRYGRNALIDALRGETAALRDELASGRLAAVTVGDAVERIEQGVEARLRAAMRPSLVRVINATGVIVHTNLGRAPLARAALERVREVAGGYTNLEYDLAAGTRGRRDTHAEKLVARLTGADAAVVVNNNAAATLLLLAAMAAGREVIISRGELVEIGGGFRVPDVMAQSGAILREVGTTNRTRAADYAAAIGDRTALILRVHPSNFKVVGFTERPALDELTALGGTSGSLSPDLGSGWLGWPDRAALLRGAARRGRSCPSIGAGADVVCFSFGDKLLGGPQAGIIAGRRDALDRIRAHPLMRALRGRSSPMRRSRRRSNPASAAGRTGAGAVDAAADGGRDRRARRRARVRACRVEAGARASSTACPPSAAAARRAPSSRRASSSSRATA
jgi:L-seryl-tRNA(Ser) seleniumtransferase